MIVLTEVSAQKSCLRLSWSSALYIGQVQQKDWWCFRVADLQSLLEIKDKSIFIHSNNNCTIYCSTCGI